MGLLKNGSWMGRRGEETTGDCGTGDLILIEATEDDGVVGAVERDPRLPNDHQDVRVTVDAEDESVDVLAVAVEESQEGEEEG